MKHLLKNAIFFNEIIEYVITNEDFEKKIEFEL